MELRCQLDTVAKDHTDAELDIEKMCISGKEKLRQHDQIDIMHFESMSEIENNLIRTKKQLDESNGRFDLLDTKLKSQGELLATSMKNEKQVHYYCTFFVLCIMSN